MILRIEIDTDKMGKFTSERSFIERTLADLAHRFGVGFQEGYREPIMDGENKVGFWETFCNKDDQIRKNLVVRIEENHAYDD